jgi:glucose-6-phosphate isomerase
METKIGVKPLTKLPAWKKLKKHYYKIKNKQLSDFFVENPERGSQMAVDAAGIYFNFANHRISKKTLALLIQLAEESNLKSRIDAMFNGEKINDSEQRAALHIALRSPSETTLLVDGKNIIPDVHLVFKKMTVFANKIRSGEWAGFTGKPIRNIINIGIGGSHLGPSLMYDALRHYCQRNLTFRFISNIDFTDFYEATIDLDPQETLFIIASKTFATAETLENAQTARDWLLSALKDPAAIARHFVAISMDEERSKAFGISKDNTFNIWDWVTGRFSVSSAISLSTMIAIGPEHFQEILNGFHQIDEHFHTAPFEKNIPVLMGLLTVWYNNFFEAQTAAIVPYDSYLRQFPEHIQQVAMESSGKYITQNGTVVNYQTGPIYWGGVGTNSQHTFHQLLYQGTKLVPCDFIGFAKPLHSFDTHHDLLITNMFAQAEILALGNNASELQAAQSPISSQYLHMLKGNQPSSTLLLEKLTPTAIGKLLAIYEHNVFTQGSIWQINTFDQWGVELAKRIARSILNKVNLRTEQRPPHKSTMDSLIRRYHAYLNKRSF